MEAVIRDDVSGKEATHEVSETATAGGLLEEVCTLFKREVLDSALEVDGAVVCTGVVGGVSGGEVSVGSLGVHSDSRLVLCRSRDRVLEVVAERVYQYGLGLDRGSLPEWAWDDEVVALAAVATVAGISVHVSKRLRASHSFMLDAVKVNWLALEHASIELRSDKEFVLAAVCGCWRSLQFASDRLKADREVVITAITNEGRSLQYAAESLRADKQVVMAAVAGVGRNAGRSLQYASEGLQADREVVMTAVANGSDSLQFASESLRADRDVVMAAVANSSGALQYASDSLKADREVVMAAVANDRDSLVFASAKLQAELRRGAPCL